MRQVIAIVLVLCTLCFFAACKKDTPTKELNFGLSEIQLKKLDSICNAYIEKGNTLGFSVAISKGDSILFSKGYGYTNNTTKTKASPNTIYALASVSKLITAVTTLRFVEQNKLSLSDKVVSYFPDFPKQEYMNEITIEHLLRHQSGVIDHEDWFDSIYLNEKRVFTQSEFFTFIDQPLFFKPGTHYSYSNAGYTILSSILEQVSGQSFHELIRAQISVPLNAESIGMWPVMWSDEQATMGYELVEKKLDTSFHMMTEGMKGGGGLSSSVLDLIKFGQALENGSLITKESHKKLLSQTQIGLIAIDYGLGVKMGDFNGQKTYGHSGGYKGTGWAMLSNYPESNITFAAAMNTNFSPEEVWTMRHDLIPVVMNIVKPEYFNSEITNGEKYLGEYASINRWGGTVGSRRIVSMENNGLLWDNPATETPGAQLYPIGKDSFSWNSFPFDVFKFHVVDGEVIGCSEYWDGMFGSVKMKLKEANKN